MNCQRELPKIDLQFTVKNQIGSSFLDMLKLYVHAHHLYVTWAVYNFLFSSVNYSKKQDTIWVDEQAKYERDCGGSHPLQRFVFSSQ